MGGGQSMEWRIIVRQFFRTFPDSSPDMRDSANEPARKPRLGVTLQPLTDQLGEFLGVPGKKGALISSVLDGSPSAGKLKSGDVVIRADAQEIREPEDLIKVIHDKSEGSLALKIIRDKREITVVVSLPPFRPKKAKESNSSRPSNPW